MCESTLWASRTHGHSAHIVLTLKETNMNTGLTITSINALNKVLIGFDTMFLDMETRNATIAPTNYPPHNLLKIGENKYEIQIAITGFDKSEVAVVVEQNILTVTGISNQYNENDDIIYIHRGLATRDFSREFPLVEHMEVRGAEIKNGMLIIKLIRNIPDSAKPKIIDIVEVR